MADSSRTTRKAKSEEKEPTLEERFHHGGRGAGSGIPIGDLPFEFDRRAVYVILIIVLAIGGSWPVIWAGALVVFLLMTIFTLKDPRCPLHRLMGEVDDAAPFGDEDRGERLLDFFSLMRYGGKGVASKEGTTRAPTEDPALYDKFIDVLIKGGVIDNNTELSEVKLRVVSADPPTFELELSQIGKTERQLVSACESALLAFDAYLVEVQDIGHTRYRIRYRIESDLEILEPQLISYEELLDRLALEQEEERAA